MEIESHTRSRLQHALVTVMRIGDEKQLILLHEVAVNNRLGTLLLPQRLEISKYIRVPMKRPTHALYDAEGRVHLLVTDEPPHAPLSYADDWTLRLHTVRLAVLGVDWDAFELRYNGNLSVARLLLPPALQDVPQFAEWLGALPTDVEFLMQHDGAGRVFGLKQEGVCDVDLSALWDTRFTQ